MVDVQPLTFHVAAISENFPKDSDLDRPIPVDSCPACIVGACYRALYDFHLEAAGEVIEQAANAQGLTHLMLASWLGALGAVRTLVRRGAMVDLSNSYGRTPLIFATMGGHEEVVRLLLQAGAAVNAVDIWGRSAISWAERRGFERIEQLLRDAGPSPEQLEADAEVARLLGEDLTDTARMDMIAAAVAAAAARNAIIAKPMHELILAKRRALELAAADANSRAQRPRSPSPPAPVPHSSTSSPRLSPHGAGYIIEGEYPLPESAQRIDAARRAAAAVGRGNMITQLTLPVWPSKPSVKGGLKVFGKPGAGYLAPTAAQGGGASHRLFGLISPSSSALPPSRRVLR